MSFIAFNKELLNNNIYPKYLNLYLTITEHEFLKSLVTLYLTKFAALLTSQE